MKYIISGRDLSILPVADDATIEKFRENARRRKRDTKGRFAADQVAAVETPPAEPDKETPSGEGKKPAWAKYLLLVKPLTK